MATNIPPHNLGEVIDACCALIDNPELTMSELMEIVPGPDFPTGGFIFGREGIAKPTRPAAARILMRAQRRGRGLRGGREAIVITESPTRSTRRT